MPNSGPSQYRVINGTVPIIAVVAIIIELTVVPPTTISPSLQLIAPSIRITRRVTWLGGVLGARCIAGDVGVTYDSTVVALIAPTAVFAARL
jgi:hypothetical protein